MGMKKSVKLVYDFIIGGLVNKIKTYKDNPELIGHDINTSYHVFKYKLLTRIDPPPKQGRKELTDDYFERIDPKYGLRFYEAMVSYNQNIDLNYALPHVEEMYGKNKSSKLLKELIIMVVDLEQKNNENYQKYILRNKLLNKKG